LGQTGDGFDGPPATVEFDGVHASLQVLGGIVDGVRRGALECPEGQIADEGWFGPARATARAWSSISVIVTGIVLG
jgi:hypothetical protein